jgi:serine-type D-Ala-D-Ala carboxypeptidase/endopeptidase
MITKSVPSDEQIGAILAQRIDEFHQSVGIVVGVVEPNGRRIISYGALDQGDPRPLNGDAVFEIGSVTKGLHFPAPLRHGPAWRSRPD